MRINNTNSGVYTPGFEAKIHLNNKAILKNTPFHNELTPLDTMFKENFLVRGLNNFAIFVKSNILCKFFDKPRNKFEQELVKIQNKAIFFSRILADRILLMSHYSKIGRINKIIEEIKPDSKEYIEEIAKIGGSVKKKYIIANTEEKTLEDLAKSNEAVIFAMNHPDYNKDKFIYVIINSLLSQMYTANNLQATCPRPKILVSRNMLKIVDKKIGEIYKHLGLIPIDASLRHKDKHFNAVVIKNLLKEFVQNKSNVFIFPEGNNSSYKDRPLANKIQPGIAAFVKSALRLKDNVKIIPIGIDYRRGKNNLGHIHIGEPMEFNRTDKTSDILYTIREKLTSEMQKAQQS